MMYNNLTDSSGRSQEQRVLLKIILIAGCIGVIFFHSLMNSDVSSAQSGAVLRFLQKLIQMFGGNPELLTMHLVRKAAHFTEYTVLGLLLFFCTRRDRGGWLYQPLFLGLLVPVLDECLQLTVPGRSGQVRDVVLDFLGVLFGIGMAFLLQKMWHILFSKHTKRSP